MLVMAAVAGAAPTMACAAPPTSVQVLNEAMTDRRFRPYRAQVEAAIACLDRFMVGFNARDVTAYDAAFNFPSVRLASNALRVIQKGDHRPEMFETGSLAEWDHSAWERRRVIHAGRDKVHFDTRFSRYRNDGTVIGGFDSMYVVNDEGGHWGVKMRSSFAP